jgi:hypothetical protein
MSTEELKEANRLHWIVKGHLIPDCWNEKSIQEMYRSYFARIWGNHEAIYHEDGFEAAWNEKMGNTDSKNT